MLEWNGYFNFSMNSTIRSIKPTQYHTNMEQEGSHLVVPEATHVFVVAEMEFPEALPFALPPGPSVEHTNKHTNSCQSS